MEVIYRTKDYFSQSEVFSQSIEKIGNSSGNKNEFEPVNILYLYYLGNLRNKVLYCDEKPK